MSEREPVRLPLRADRGEAQDVQGCEPRVGVTHEEAAIVAAMVALRRRAEAVRGRLASAKGDERERLEAELETLRAERVELVRRREEAFRRKMVMLGHLAEGE